MERETTAIGIENHTFLVKTYASAREVNAIQGAYFRGSKVEVVGDQPKISDFNPAVQAEVQKEMVAQMVVKADDQTEGIADYCLDLPNHIYVELCRELDQIIAKKKS